MVVHWGGTSQFWHFQFASPQLLRYLTHTGVGISPIQVSVSHPYRCQCRTHIPNVVSYIELPAFILSAWSVQKEI